MLKQQRCLITGGAGFIGSHLADYLLDLGFNVTVVDNCITGDEKNIRHLQDNQHFTFINHDVTKPIIMEDPVHFIFHLASPASVIDYQRYPEETAMVNSIGTRNMVQLAKEMSARILFASTSEVYGDPKEHPQKESYWGNVNPNGQRACYDESKRFGEMIMQLYFRSHNVDTRIIRIFNTYGPRMRPTDGRVVSNFINQAISNMPLTMYGNGKQTRSFCYVSDLVSGIWAVMNAKELRGEVVNLGNPEEFTMIELARKIIAMTKSTSEIAYLKLPEDDPMIRRPDIEKVHSIAGWMPKVALDDGLANTIRYYQLLK